MKLLDKVKYLLLKTKGKGVLLVNHSDYIELLATAAPSPHPTEGIVCFGMPVIKDEHVKEPYVLNIEQVNVFQRFVSHFVWRH